MLDSLTIEDIQNEEQKKIVTLIGLKAYIKLVKNYGGSSIYVFKGDTLVKEKRNKKIRADFNGYNYSELVKKYNLSERAIRDILGYKNQSLDGQIRFEFD